jgi:hypothetical protein
MTIVVGNENYISSDGMLVVEKSSQMPLTKYADVLSKVVPEFYKEQQQPLVSQFL